MEAPATGAHVHARRLQHRVRFGQALLQLRGPPLHVLGHGADDADQPQVVVAARHAPQAGTGLLTGNGDRIQDHRLIGNDGRGQRGHQEGRSERTRHERERTDNPTTRAQIRSLEVLRRLARLESSRRLIKSRLGGADGNAARRPADAAHQIRSSGTWYCGSA